MDNDEILEADLYEVGSLIILCPRCDADIKIPIKAGVVKDDGKLYVRTTSDVADYWSHAFMHKEGKI